MKTRFLTIGIFLLTMHITGCSDGASKKIQESLSDYTQKNNPEFKSISIDSITYVLADSTVYFNRTLNFLAERSESFSKMATLRANLAQSKMNDLLSGDKGDNYLESKIKHDLDKSLEALKQNEREWNVINDSMDLMFKAIHSTDTLKKVFYQVSFSLNAVSENKKILQTRKAILNKNNFKVVFVD